MSSSPSGVEERVDLKNVFKLEKPPLQGLTWES